MRGAQVRHPLIIGHHVLSIIFFPYATLRHRSLLVVLFFVCTEVSHHTTSRRHAISEQYPYGGVLHLTPPPRHRLAAFLCALVGCPRAARGSWLGPRPVSTADPFACR